MDKQHGMEWRTFHFALSAIKDYRQISKVS